MPRPSPNNRATNRKTMLDRVDEAIVKTSDAMHKGIGNAIGGLYEKAKLGGKQGSGNVKFSETPEGKRRRTSKAVKGIASSKEF